MSSPKFLRKISHKGRPLKVLVLGQPSVGKTALSVRFITRRFIGDYDPTLERRYQCQRKIEGDSITFDVFDTAGQMCIDDDDLLGEKIRWADAFVLVYSVNDRCSLDECTRLKFLISHLASKRSRKLSMGDQSSGGMVVALVGNKSDLEAERMVSPTEGLERSHHLGCSVFFDISVRESYQDASKVFEDLYLTIKRRSKLSRKHRLQHQDAILDSPPSPMISDYKSSVDSSSPPSPRRRESRVPVLGFSKDEPCEERFLRIPCNLSLEQERPRRKRSVSRRIMRKMMPSLSAGSSRETDSFRSDSDGTLDSS